MGAEEGVSVGTGVGADRGPGVGAGVGAAVGRASGTAVGAKEDDAALGVGVGSDAGTLVPLSFERRLSLESAPATVENIRVKPVHTNCPSEDTHGGVSRDR